MSVALTFTKMIAVFYSSGNMIYSLLFTSGVNRIAPWHLTYVSSAQKALEALI